MNKKGQEQINQIGQAGSSVWKKLFLGLIILLVLGGIIALVWHYWLSSYDRCDINKDGKIDEKESAICEQTINNTIKTTCGDGLCRTKDGETSKNCPEDCSDVAQNISCPNGECDEKELAQGICPEDCGGSQLNLTNQTNQNLSEYEDSPFGISAESISENQEKEAILNDLGVRWMRPGIPWFDIEPTEGNFDFSAKDDYINSMYVSNLKAVMTLSSSTPWDQCLCHNKCACSMPIGGGRYECFYIYCIQENYKNYVKKAVERYDGDSDYGCVVSAPDCYNAGDNQYPSSETIEAIQNNPIKYWEVLNEPFSEGYWKSWVIGNVTTEYIDILESSNEAIKEVCSDCKVVIGGLYDYVGGGSINKMTLEIIKFALEARDNPFDVMNFHSYGNRSNMVLSLDYFTQNYPDKELIITEIALGARDNRLEKDFAQDLTRRYILSIGAGVRIIMWFPLIDDGTKYGEPGLVAADGTKRLNYYSYKLMTEKLEGSDWSNVQEVYNSENVYAYKFINKQTNKPIYVVWWEYWNEPTLITKQVSIPVSISGNVKITESVPHFETGLLLQNSGEVYPNFFDVENKQVSSEDISLTLGESPVYVEQA